MPEKLTSVSLAYVPGLRGEVALCIRTDQGDYTATATTLRQIRAKAQALAAAFPELVEIMRLFADPDVGGMPDILEDRKNVSH
jgi:hypothetical protein